MCKYSTLIFAWLKTPYNKPFNWGNTEEQKSHILAIT